MSKSSKRSLVIHAVGALGITTLLVASLVLVVPLVAEQWYISELGSADLETRLRAARKLGELQSSRAIPALLEIPVQEADTWQTVLDSYGQDGFRVNWTETVNAALACFNDNRGEPVRFRAAYLLGWLDSGSMSKIPFGRCPILTDQSQRVRACLVYALGENGPRDTDTLKLLFEALDNDTEPAVDEGSYSAEDCADTALSGFVPEGRDAVAVLVDVLTNKMNGTDKRIIALDVIGRMGKSAAEAVPALVSLIKSEKEEIEIRKEAVRALGEIGMCGRKVVDLLSSVASDEDSGFRSAAAYALGEYGGKEALVTLVDLLSDKVEPVRWCAIEALGKLGPIASDAAPLLVQCLDDVSHEIRCRAAYALGGIGKEGIAPVMGDALPRLTIALGEDNSRVRAGAAKALGTLGPDAQPVVPLLIRALQDGDWLTQKEAAVALGKVGSGARDAIPALLSLSREAEIAEVRKAANEALRKIKNCGATVAGQR